MASYISTTVDLTTDDTVIIPVNGRWSEGNYSAIVTFAGTGTVKYEGTVSKINQGETAVWFDITNLTAVVADAAENIVNTPFEAFRISGTTMAGGGATAQLMGAGAA